MSVPPDPPGPARERAAGGVRGPYRRAVERLPDRPLDLQRRLQRRPRRELALGGAGVAGRRDDERVRGRPAAQPHARAERAELRGAGVEDGKRIRLSGEGEAGLNGAPSGDLYIFITVAPHHIFQRDSANIYCKVPLPFTVASLGGHIEVPTVDGSRARITIPSGTQSGHQFRLKAKGMSILRSKERGDMFVQASVETPVNLSKKQKDLLKEFEQEGKSADNSPESAGFFSKVKDLWEDLKD